MKSSHLEFVSKAKIALMAVCDTSSTLYISPLQNKGFGRRPPSRKRIIILISQNVMTMIENTSLFAGFRACWQEAAAKLTVFMHGNEGLRIQSTNS